MSIGIGSSTAFQFLRQNQALSQQSIDLQQTVAQQSGDRLVARAGQNSAKIQEIAVSALQRQANRGSGLDITV